MKLIGVKKQVVEFKRRIILFRNKLMEEGNWNIEEEVNVMWNEMIVYIRKVAKDVLGVSRGKSQLYKETCW